jgi:hypothetical protein
MGAYQYYKTNEDLPGSYHSKSNEKSQVELPSILLEKLILSGLLPGNECKCLDDTARKTLWNSLLKGSLNGEKRSCL